MSKQTIEWHTKCLENQKKSHELELHRLARQIDVVKKSKESIELLSAQIGRAIAEGKQSFDSERYSIKKS